MKISKRHIFKSISWRLIGTIDTFVFAWLITGDLNDGLNLSGITTFTLFEMIGPQVLGYALILMSIYYITINNLEKRNESVI